MIFANPQFFWLLLLLPLMLVYLLFIRPHNILTFRFSSAKLIEGFDDHQRLKRVIYGPGLLRILAIFLLIVALARPQKGLKSEEMMTKATDIIICLDSSQSMLSIDFKPENRFAVAKQVVKDFIQGREYDRMGMVLFAESAVTQCPLTTDKNTLLNIVDRLEVGSIPSERTAIGLGLATSVNRLKNSVAKSKVIILVTDGVNNSGNIDPLTAAKTATTFNIKIYAIGAGSPGGGQIPINDPIFGQRIIQTQDELDEELLTRIASETGGHYFRAKTADNLKSIFKEIDAMEKTDISVKSYVDYEELYAIFLLMGLIIVMGEALLSLTMLRTAP